MLARKINLGQDERIDQVIYQHYFRFIGKYFFAAILLLSISFFSVWLLHHDWWGEALLIGGITIGFYTLVRTWLVHTGNLLVITSERVVRVQRRGWFDELVTSIAFEAVSNTTIRRQGIWGRFFKYGTLVLYSAEDGLALEMSFVPDPELVEQSLFDQQRQLNNAAQRTDRDGVYGRFLMLLPDFSLSQLTAAAEAIERQISEQERIGPKT